MGDKEKLDHLINFRATEEMYVDLLKYLENANKTISVFMREITYDFLKFKESMKENGYNNEHIVKKEMYEIKVDLDQIEANKFCDGDSCEVPPMEMIKKEVLLRVLTP